MELYKINRQLLGTDIGYAHFRKLAESGLCIPIATVQRSFSAMNRIMTKIGNRMEQATLEYCIKISTNDEHSYYLGLSKGQSICLKENK
jgi:hypothetical protein